MTFETWLRKVSRRLDEGFNLDPEDFEDKPLRDWYEQGVRPGEAVVGILTKTDPRENVALRESHIETDDERLSRWLDPRRVALRERARRRAAQMREAS